MPGPKPQPGSFCWNELLTRDVAKAKQFYCQLFGWTTKEDQAAGRTYTMFIPPGSPGPVGGMMAMEGPQFQGVPAQWLSYISVKSVDESAKQCVKLGGTVQCPPMDIPNIGRFCVIADPTGAVVALFQGV